MGMLLLMALASNLAFLNSVKNIRSNPVLRSFVYFAPAVLMTIWVLLANYSSFDDRVASFICCLCFLALVVFLF